MPIVDFEQDPQAPYGTGNFRDDTGRIMYAYDPDTAQQFSKTMKGSRAGGDQRTALNAPIPGADLKALQGTAPDFAGGKTAADVVSLTPGAEGRPERTPPAPAPTPAPEAAPAAPAAAPAAAGPAPGPGASLVQSLDAVKAEAAPPTAGAPASPAAPATVGAPPAVGSGAGASLVQTLDSARPGAPLSARSEPTRAPEPRQFDSGGLPLGSVSAGDSISVEKGIPVEKALEEINDREAIGQVGDQLIADTYERQGQQAARGYEQGRNTARADYGRNVQRAFEARAEREAAEQDLTRLRKAYEENDKSEDPERFMRNMSTGSFVATALLAALNGAFGAQLGQQRNGVVDALDQAIDRDLQRQKDEIASGRIRIGNEIDRRMKEGHSADEAYKLARDALVGNMNAFLDLESKRVNALPEARAQAQLLIQPRLEQRAKDRAETMRLTYDKINIAKRAEQQYQMPQVVGMTPQDMLAMIQLNEKQTEHENTKPVEAAVGHPVSIGEAQDIRTDAKTYAQKRATIGATRAILNQLAQKLKLSYENGRFTGTPDAGVRPLGSSALSEQAREIDRAYSMLKRADVMGMTREPSAKLQDEFGRITARPFWDSDIPQQLSDIASILDQAEGELDQGFGNDVTNYYSYMQQQRRSPPAPPAAPPAPAAPARGAKPPASRAAPAPAAPAAEPAAPAAAPPPKQSSKLPGGLRLE